MVHDCASRSTCLSDSRGRILGHLDPGTRWPIDVEAVADIQHDSHCEPSHRVHPVGGIIYGTLAEYQSFLTLFVREQGRFRFGKREL